MKESQIIEITGLTKDILREFRESGTYKEGEDWVKIPSKRPEKFWVIDWTEQGFKTLKANINFTPVMTKEEILKNTKRGKVLAKFKNPRVIRVDIEGKEVNVLVSSSEKFKVGMPVDCAWDGARYVARRTPRFFGKY